MILVIGATGLVGGEAARILLERGEGVRALVRGGGARAEGAALRNSGAEVVDGDLTRPETLIPLCAGIRAVVFTATAMPLGTDDGIRRVDLEGALALIRAAKGAGVTRFVYLSYSGTLATPSPLSHAKRTCEQTLRDSGMTGIILRPTVFAEVWLSPIVGFDPAGGRARIYGTGNEQVSYISALDVAEFAAAAATLSDPGETLEMGGPEPLSLREVIRRYEKARGVALALGVVPAAALEEGYRAATDPTQKSLAALILSYAAGDPIPDARKNAERFGVRLRTVEEVLGIS